MKFNSFFIYFIIFFCQINFLSAENSAIIVGWLERVIIYPPEIIMHAKIDTGADSCSIHAEKIKFKKNSSGVLSVEFFIENRYGEIRKLKRKVIRTAKIKTKTGGVQVRPVVSIKICLNTIHENIECNLVDRSHFDYPVLLGRNFLASNILVDSSETYLSEPKCEIKNEK